MQKSLPYAQSQTSLDCNMIQDVDWYETYMDLTREDSSPVVHIGNKQDTIFLELKNEVDHEFFTSEGNEHLPGIFEQLNWIDPIEDGSSLYDPLENAIMEADKAEEKADGERVLNSLVQMADDTANILAKRDSTLQLDQGMKTVIIPYIDNMESTISPSQVMSSDLKIDQMDASPSVSSGQMMNNLTLNMPPACIDLFVDSSSINTPDVLEFISSDTFNIMSYIQQDDANIPVSDVPITDSSDTSNATENNLSSTEVSAPITVEGSTTESANKEVILNTDVSRVTPAEEESLVSLDASVETALTTSVGNFKATAKDNVSSGILENLRSVKVASKHKVVGSDGPSPKYACIVKSPESKVTATGKKSDGKYQSMRDKNNEASRKSRLNHKNKLAVMEHEKIRLERENEKLNIKVLTLERLKEEVKKLLIEQMVKSGQCVENI